MAPALCSPESHGQAALPLYSLIKSYIYQLCHAGPIRLQARPAGPHPPPAPAPGPPLESMVLWSIQGSLRVTWERPPRQSAVGWHSCSCTLEVNQRLGRPRLHCRVVRKLLRARLGKMMVVLR